jgi:hypothetical protein
MNKQRVSDEKVQSVSLCCHGVCLQSRLALDLLDSRRDLAAALERVAELEKSLPLWRHASNEWADCATNGLQWLKNVKTQTSEIEPAIDAMAENIRYCQTVSIIAHDAAQKARS